MLHLTFLGCSSLSLETPPLISCPPASPLSVPYLLLLEFFPFDVFDGHVLSLFDCCAPMTPSTSYYVAGFLHTSLQSFEVILSTPSFPLILDPLVADLPFSGLLGA